MLSPPVLPHTSAFLALPRSLLLFLLLLATPFGHRYVAAEGINGQFCVAAHRKAAFAARLQTVAAASLTASPTHAAGTALAAPGGTAATAAGGASPIHDVSSSRSRHGAAPGVGGGGGGAALELNWGEALAAGTPSPFRRFRVVLRPQILTDGLLPRPSSTPSLVTGSSVVGSSMAGSGESSGDAGGRLADSAGGAAVGAPVAAPLDCTGDTGIELEPWQWHQELSLWREGAAAPDAAASADAADGAVAHGGRPLLLDCRNSYESDAGAFEGALFKGLLSLVKAFPSSFFFFLLGGEGGKIRRYPSLLRLCVLHVCACYLLHAVRACLFTAQGAVPLGTAAFSESWAVLDEVAATLPTKDAPVYTYCTGGIR